MSQEITFQKLNSNSGLSSDNVTDIIQDKEGYIWMTTDNGINRFDGYTFVNFTPDFNTEGHFNTVNHRCLEEDQNERIWFGSYNMGINIYDKTTGIVEVLDEEGPEGSRIRDNHINDIFCDDDGNIWIGTSNGLNMYDYEKDSIGTFTSEFFPDQISANLNVTKIYQSSRGEIIIGTFGNGIFVYEESKSKFYQIEFQSLDSINGGENRIYDILEDARGDFWIGTWGAGLYHIRIFNDQSYKVLKVIDQTYTGNQSQMLSSPIIFSIYEDDESNIWVGTPYGLNIISEAYSNAPKITTIRAGNTENHVSHNEVYKIFEDRSGITWIITRGGGINKIDPSVNRFKTYSMPVIDGFKESQTVRSFLMYNDSVLLVGVNGLGFGQYIPEKEQFIPYYEIEDFRNLPSNINAAVRFHIDHRKNLWIGTRYYGVYVINHQTKVCSNFLGVDSPYNEFTMHINAIMEDRFHNIWVGNEAGLFKFIPGENGQGFIMHEFSLGDSDSLRGNFVNSLYEDSEGYIWIGTFGNGLKRFYNDGTNAEKSIQHFVFDRDAEERLSCNFINAIYEDKYRRLWVATGTAGLAQFNRKDNSFTHLRQENGMSSNNTLDILEHGDNLWITTNKGLTRLSYKGNNNSQFEIFNFEDGLQGNVFIKGSVYKDQKDQIYAGGYYGFNIFDPERIVTNNYIPSLVINSIIIAGEERNRYQLIKDGISLPYNRNNIKIEFAALSYVQQNKNKYSYILEGFDNTWHNVNYDNREINYNSLPAGNYTFRFLASNSSGIWTNEPFSFDFTIRIHPARSWWAILFYSIVFIGLVATLYKFQIRNIKTKQAYEIERIDRVKEDKVNQFKFRFFTNISHELLTPLSVIFYGMEDLLNNNEINRKTVKLMHKNSSRLMQLISQLLDFRKVESQTMKLLVSHGDINALLENISDCLYPLAEKKSIQFFMEGKVGKMIYFDHDKINKIVSNLLSNALRYTPENGKIFINYSVHSIENSDWLSIEVIDSGKGIEPEILPNIFDRFYMVNSVSGKTFGAGIGLALVRSLTEVHKGTISVENDKEFGAAFKVMIPVSKDAYSTDDLHEIEYAYQNKNFLVDHEEYQHSEPEEIDISEDIVQQSNTKILVVEDNNDFRQMISKHLSIYYTVLEATNGEEGFKTCVEKSPDLVIADIMMPKMNGIELCNKIKNTFETSHIMVIMLTAKVDEQTRFESYKADANSYISKPVKMNMLLMRVQSLLKQKRLEFEKFNSGIVTHTQSDGMSEVDQSFIKNVREIIENKISNSELNVLALSKELGTSKSMLYRKITNLTGMSPVEYIRHIRLQNAAKLLLDEVMNVSEAAYASGFIDLSYFSACFKTQFGVSPKYYAKKVKLNETTKK